MVPLRDNNPTRSTPLVTYGIITLNVVVFVHELRLGESLNQFFQLWALVPAELTANLQGQPTDLPHPAWITLFTSQFLHGGLLHIAGNMLFLWVFGNNVEDQLGRLKYIVFYLSCGALAALSQWFFNIHSDIPSLGASGAIAGVMGAYIIRFPRAEVLTLIPLGFFWWTVNLPAVFFLGFWFAQQAFNSVASLNAPMNMGGIAYWAHAGGFVFGALLGPLLGLFNDRPQR
ncbi:MAG: rhomboid family intramembrane serine protease [Acaryochloridaceae cyanobacterium CSU_3_4]|nr:rhomboid family intramembrane serine protease [Acaryochloris sp. SU_5_25]NJN37796.1 rhomboid family intramembrane serine protease [Acaryochloridaceae cyanobacterium CSU_3_4]